MIQINILICFAFARVAISDINSNRIENAAFGKPVYYKGSGGYGLTDGSYSTVVSPDVDRWPFVAVDLLDIYQIFSLQIHAQNQLSLGNEGLNVKFSVYVWSNDTYPCELKTYYPWKLVRSGLKFIRRGQAIVVVKPIQARYIIIMTERDDVTNEVAGITMSELRAFGRKVRDGYHPENFDGDPDIIEQHNDVRRKLLNGVNQVEFNSAYHELKLSPTHEDVAVCWYAKLISMVANQRGKGRIVTFVGNTILDQLEGSDVEYTTLRQNFISWLRPTDPSARIVGVKQTFNAGDILKIKRDDQFDVDAIYNKIYTGENSAIIAFKGLWNDVEDDLTKLMKKLDIKYSRHGVNYQRYNVSTSALVDSIRYVPLHSLLEGATRSFKYLNKLIFDAETFSEDEIKNVKAQSIVKLIIQRYLKYFTYYAMCDIHPYRSYPDTDNAFFNFNQVLLLQRDLKIQTAPAFSYAPGKIHHSEKPTTYTVRYDVDVAGSFFPMGAFAKAGESFRYTVLNVSDPTLKGFRIRINPQTDKLINLHTLYRWPVVSSVRNLAMEDQVSSPFGGPITLQIPANGKLTIRFENVYRYPWFDIRNSDSVSKWETERTNYKGVPYLMLVGDNMISMLSTEIAIKVNRVELEWIVNYFDNMIKLMHNYRGTSHEKSRVEVFVTDYQVCVGAAHAGYPWMALNSWASSFVDTNAIKQGISVGIPHELGHNLQVYGMTFVNGGEVTNNLYIPMVHKYLLGLKTFEDYSILRKRDMDIDQLVQTWRDGTYVGVRESYYVLLGHYFSPALVGNVLHLVTGTNVPLTTEPQKIKFWISNLCIESGYDLVLFHRLWHFDVDAETVATCSQYPCWFPDDPITQRVPDLVKNLTGASSTNCSSAAPTQVAYKFDVMAGLNTRKPQSIFIQH